MNASITSTPASMTPTPISTAQHKRQRYTPRNKFNCLTNKILIAHEALLNPLSPKQTCIYLLEEAYSEAINTIKDYENIIYSQQLELDKYETSLTEIAKAIEVN